MATPKQYQEAPPVDGYSDSAFVDAQSAQSSWLAHAEEQEGRHELLFGADSSHAPPPTAPPLQQLEQHEQLSATVEIPQQLDSEDSMQWHYQEPQPQLQQQTQQQQAVHGHAPRYAATASPRGDISPLQAKDYDQDNDSGAEFTTEPEEEETHYTGYDDVDSAYGGDSMIGDDTTSLRSYITDYVYENGRRYHRYRDGAYWVSFFSWLFISGNLFYLFCMSITQFAKSRLCVFRVRTTTRRPILSTMRTTSTSLRSTRSCT